MSEGEMVESKSAVYMTCSLFVTNGRRETPRDDPRGSRLPFDTYTASNYTCMSIILFIAMLVF